MLFVLAELPEALLKQGVEFRNSSIEERPIGGLGLALVRRLMDEVQYERRDGKNRLRLVRRLVAIEA